MLLQLQTTDGYQTGPNDVMNMAANTMHVYDASLHALLEIVITE